MIFGRMSRLKVALNNGTGFSLLLVGDMPSQLTLNFIWGEYESYCKPQSNELRAFNDVLKKLTQGSLPADDWMTKLQSQLHLCNYKPEMEEVLLRDLFLFGLQDESFMSKIISEESPNVTTAQL